MIAINEMIIANCTMNDSNKILHTWPFECPLLNYKWYGNENNRSIHVYKKMMTTKTIGDKRKISTKEKYGLWILKHKNYCRCTSTRGTHKKLEVGLNKIQTLT